MSTLMKLGTIATTAAFASIQNVNAAQSFTKVQDHQGSSFLDNWIFYNGIDANNTGNVLFQTKEQAQQEQLTFLNSAGNFIIKVDNTTDGTNDPNFGRPSVKLLSSYTITSGNLVLFDAVHLPFGCSVWPAFWSQGPVWPDDGEIDIIEGANLQSQNSISLHTLDGCTHPDSSSSSSIETGQLVSTDCFNQTNGNQGCIVNVPGNSYGQDFSNNGGGAYALNWNTSGIYIWFFPRSSIPSDFTSDSPNPDGWGLPSAAYPQSSCNTDQFIHPQTLILDITICGNFAGASNVFSQTCSGSCLDLVQTPSNYDNAFFEISFIKVFEASGSEAATASNGAGAVTTSADSSASTVSSSSSSSSSGSATVKGASFTLFQSTLGTTLIGAVAFYLLSH